MPFGTYSESEYESAVLETLHRAGWTIQHGPDIERDYRDPTCPETVKSQMHRLNPDVPSDAIDAAYMKLRDIAGGTVVARNFVFSDYLQSGIEASCTVDGEERTYIVRLVDFKHPERNSFDAINRSALTFPASS